MSKDSKVWIKPEQRKLVGSDPNAPPRPAGKLHGRPLRAPVLMCVPLAAEAQAERKDGSHPVHVDNCILNAEALVCIKEPPAYTFRDFRCQWSSGPQGPVPCSFGTSFSQSPGPSGLEIRQYGNGYSVVGEQNGERRMWCRNSPEKGMVRAQG